jgi:hypothetical protein
MVVLTAMLIDSQVMLRDECDLRAHLDSRGMAPPFAPTCAPRDCCQNAAYRAHLRRAAQPPCAWPALSARRHHHQPCAQPGVSSSFTFCPCLACCPQGQNGVGHCTGEPLRISGGAEPPRTAAESGVARAPRGAGGAALTPCCPRARQARQALDTGPWAGRFGVPRPQDLARAGHTGWQRLAARGLGERRRRPSARYVAAPKPQAGQNGGRDCPQGTASDDPAALPVSSLRCVAARC